jgi:hypothetical protein
LLGDEAPVRFIENVVELGLHGLHAQNRAHRAQAQIIPTASFYPHLKPMKFLSPSPTSTKATHKGDGIGDDTQRNNTVADGCEATIMLIRHCEKGNLRSHCSFMGYERSVYLSTLFGPDGERWPSPSAIYALSKGRGSGAHTKLNYREVETVNAVSDKTHVEVDHEYSTADTKRLARTLLDRLLEGDMCGKLTLISWKHSDIPRLAQHLGCGPLEGCPWDYKGRDFDSTWQIRYVCLQKEYSIY